MIDSMQEDDRYLTLIIGVSDETEVQNELLEPLRAEGVQADIPPQGGAVPLDTIFGFIEATAAAIFIAERIIAWAHSVRNRPHVPHLRLRRPQRAELDPITASDDETRNYVVSDRDQSEPKTR